MIKAKLLSLSILAISATALPANEKPNIVLVMTDDQGWGDVAYYGNPVVKTPHLDAMSKGVFVLIASTQPPLSVPQPEAVASPADILTATESYGLEKTVSPWVNSHWLKLSARQATPQVTSANGTLAR